MLNCTGITPVTVSEPIIVNAIIGIPYTPNEGCVLSPIINQKYGNLWLAFGSEGYMIFVDHNP